ncbi:DUF2269 family protein [Microbacterium soli]|uniref:DUF2269 family protein n=1 Tax=Microbacterium soli TaxID=446075 RepID=A0ABP7N328_9MICO
MSIWLLLKATHVVGAIMLMGPAFGYGIIAAMGQRQPQHRGFANTVVGVLDKRMFKPGLALVIASGLLMGILSLTSEYGNVFAEGWLIVSIIITALALGYSHTVHRGNQRRIGELARQAAGDGADAALEEQIVAVRRRLKIGGKAIAYSYGVVAALMVLKPF